jgi:hypothetical protein
LVLKVRDERIESRSELVASQIKYPLYRADVVLYGRHYGSQAEAGEDEGRREKNPRKLSPFERAATLDLQQLGNNETNKSITLYLSTPKPTRGEIRSIGRSFRNGKKKGRTICDTRFLNEDERIAVAPLLVGRSAPPIFPEF